jgi:hypothetical protein
VKAVASRRTKVQCELDFIREILLAVEADPELDGYHVRVFDNSDFPEHSNEEICYHVDLLIEAGFLQSEGMTSGAPSPEVSRLTWNGHEFLGSAKDPGVWVSVKERLRGLSGFTLDVVAEIAKAEIRKRLGLS